MSESCPNCARPVLPTDTVCWHCGHQLAPRAKQRPRSEPDRRRPPSRSPAGAGETEAEPVDLRAIAAYGVLTLVVILGLLLVMRSLSRQPVLVRSAGFNLDGDWVAVTDSELRYTISMPVEWLWFDLGPADQNDLLDRLAERQPFIRRALLPLGEMAGDVEILSLAIAAEEEELEDPRPRPVIVVGRSERMRELTPEEALELLAGQSPPATDQAVDTHLAGQRQARFETADTAGLYQCRHLFVTDGGAAAYLVAACAPQSQFRTLDNTLDDMLDSFQLLQR